MTTHYGFVCQDCGAKYTLQCSGPGCREFNNGATREHCAKCAPKHYVPPPAPTHRWVLTDEVTPEQMFAWAKEDWDKQKPIPYLGLKARRSYMGLVKPDGSDFQEAIWSHGYKMVFWVKSREVDAIYKNVRRSKLDMLTRGIFHDWWHDRQEKKHFKRLEESRPKERFVVTPKPFPKVPAVGIFYYDFRCGDGCEGDE